MVNRSRSGSQSSRRGGGGRFTPSPSSSFRGTNKGLSIGEFPLSSLLVFRELESYPSVVMAACGLAVTLGILIQIRSLRNDAPPSLVDRLPSYRFYKARFLKGAYTQGVVTCLAMYRILPFLDSDPNYLDSYLYTSIDSSSVTNAPFIEKPTSQNYDMYLHGAISRMTGLLNSCPATNFSVFNFPASARSAKVEDVLKLLPFPAEDMPSAAAVVSFLQENILAPEERPAFEEEALAGDSGLTPLELEVFGSVMSRRPPVSNRLVRGSTLPGNAVAREEIDSVLSPIEAAQYRLSIGTNPARLRELTAVAVSRINERKAAAADAASPAAPAGVAAPGPAIQAGPPVSSDIVVDQGTEVNPTSGPLPAAAPKKRGPGRPSKAAAFKAAGSPPSALSSPPPPTSDSASGPLGLDGKKVGSPGAETAGVALSSSEPESSSSAPASSLDRTPTPGKVSGGSSQTGDGAQHEEKASSS